MRLSIYIFVILSFIALFMDSAYSKSIHISKEKKISSVNKEKEEKKEEKKDQFYIIIVDNPYANDTTLDTKHKRDLNSIFIDELVSDIHTLILENKDTYESTEVLEELDNEGEQRKRKRSEQSTIDNGISNYVYPISSTKKYTTLYAYLSNDLAIKVDEMTNIKACEPELELETVMGNYSNYQSEVKKEAGWKNNASRRMETSTHLSVLSQGKYDSQYIVNYDDAYYYPETAGSGVDVFVIDLGFNFRLNEFNKQRHNCWAYAKNGKIVMYDSGKDVCFGDDVNELDDVAKNHGTILAEVIGGAEHGVAPKANIHAVVLTNGKGLPVADIMAALQAIKDYKSNKKVIVISHMYILKPNQRSATQVLNFEDLINDVTESSVFVNCAGNESSPINGDKVFYPCIVDSVFCIGSIDNDVNNLKSMNTNSYKLASFSNYGKEVNAYAPGAFLVSYQTYYSENIYNQKKYGSSYTAGLGAGVVATYMSDQNKGYSSKSMIQLINKMGVKNVISGLPSGSNNVLLNNGKHIVYSKNDKYKNGVCGLSAGNRKCSNECCSKYGYCGVSDDHCYSGCQSQFGICY